MTSDPASSNDGDSFGSIARRFLYLAIPMALSNLTVPLTGMVDLGMLGHLGVVEHMAGMGLATVLFDLLYWPFTFLVFGTVAAAADAAGRGNHHGVLLALVRSALLGLAIGAVILLLAVPIRELGFTLLSGEAGVKDAGRAYYNGRIWGAPAVLFNYAFFGWLVAREKTHVVLALDLLTNGTNVVLDYIFIFVLDLAGFGAGLATMMSQYLMTAAALVIIAREKPELSALKDAVFERAALAKLLRLNRDIFMRTFCLVAAYTLFTNTSAAIGTIVLAANAMLIKLLEMAAMCMDGVVLGVETLTAFFVGRGDHASVRRLLRLGFTVALALGLTFIVTFVTFGEPIYALLTSHAEVIATARAHQFGLFAMLLGVAATYVFDGYLLGLHEGRIMRNCVFVSLVVFYLPVAAAAWRLQSNALLWTALVVFMAARMATMALAIRGRATSGTG